ncbi:MAG: mercury resistance system periplasmic binding protein MerP [Burkholderiales bacterium]
MMKRALLAAFVFAASAAPAQRSLAGEKTVVLEVPKMYCAACPITVRKALEKVAGVAKVKATYEPKEAAVTFDDAETSVEKLMEATKQAGYPSNVKPGK